MSANRRVPLAAVKYVNFHSDAYTIARRTDPIRLSLPPPTFSLRANVSAQQTCIGEACARHQPQNILCENMGSDGVGGFQWKCEADLPSGLRFGKVDVSCEGWERPGDTNILHGSCGLEYNLVRIDGDLERGEEDPYLPPKSGKLFDNAFNLLFLLISGVILYSLIRNVIKSVYPRWTPPALFRNGPPGPGGGGGGGGPAGGWNPGSGGGGNDDYDSFSGAPPPPYTKTHPGGQIPPQNQGQQGWTPGVGFFTGLAAGGLGTYFAANRNRTPAQTSAQRGLGGGTRSYGNGVAGPGPSTAAQNQARNRDRGGLWGSDMGGGSGEMRRATGFGGTSVR